jgi:inosine-uridine nucleoside N-ribohydrolase
MQKNKLSILFPVCAMICLTGSASVLCGSCSSPRTDKQQARTPASVIFDTDMGPDYDDAGALTLLHALADSGEVKILATVSSNLDTLAVPCIDVINTYFGRPDIPLGAPKAGVNMGDLWHREKWTEALAAKYPHTVKSTADAPDAVQIYRRILAEAPDTSVVVVTVGFLTNLAGLLESASDRFSPLNGRELAKKKVKRLVSMAGQFPAGREFNVFCDSAASIKVFNGWPSRIVLSGFEIGEKILTGRRLTASGIAETPAKTVFSICLKQGDFDGRMSWDEVTVLAAIRGAEKYFNTVKGQIIVNPDGSNTWRDDPDGRHEHLVWKTPVEELTTVIEDLMMHERVERNHGR